MNGVFLTIEEISQICQLETDFILELARFGVIQIQKRENRACVLQESIELLNIAKRLSTELGVNWEGIEIILTMRRQILDLQAEVENLNQKVHSLSKEQQYRNLKIIIEKGLLFDA